MGNEETKEFGKSKCVQYAEEGLLGAQYTLNSWFVKVKPILSMDGSNQFAADRPSILFSFVEKGKNGAGFDIYVDIDTFDLWADDVLSVTEKFYKVIMKEKGEGIKYPTHYKFTTGTNGEKSLGFAPGDKAFAVINGVTVKNGKKVYANIPAEYDWFRLICKKYRRVTAAWHSMMANATLTNSMKYWKKPDQLEDMMDTPDDHQPEKPTSPEPPQNNAASKPADAQADSDKADATPPAQSAAADSEPKINTAATEKISFTNITPLKPLNNNNGFALQAKIKGAGADGSVQNVIFLNDKINAIEPGRWEQFQHIVSKGSQLFKGVFYKNDHGNYYFVKFC